ncbi:MAG: hypothetical protein FJ381_03070 [Verrucomicrobia bacterium]|nr:hypothetical protein [Verrucomicrobiota bacterium]
MPCFLPKLVWLLLCTIVGLTAVDPPTPTGSRVEPLTLPLRLSMTANKVIAALGSPRLDNRAFGGGIGYPGLRMLFDATRRGIRALTMEGGARLASGIGVGTALARVQAEYPGGTVV